MVADDHLYQRNKIGWQPEVRGKRTLGVLCARSDICDAQSGGVAQQRHLHRQQRVQPRKDVLFKLQLFKHGLNHDLCRFTGVLQIGIGLHQRQGIRNLLPGTQALRHQFV